jgi:hypothetical protein
VDEDNGGAILACLPVARTDAVHIDKDVGESCFTSHRFPSPGPFMKALYFPTIPQMTKEKS